MTVHLQHRSDHYRILSLEVVRDAYGKHLYCDDLASTARRTVHTWIARNEELGKLVHELARRIGAPLYELGAVRESGEQFRAAGRSETGSPQAVVCWEVTVHLLRLDYRGPAWVCKHAWVIAVLGGSPRSAPTSTQDCQSIWRMPIVTL
jgi:hypothetical protein